MARKTKYKLEYCEKIQEHMKDGSSPASFGSSINVSTGTLKAWCKKFPEFKEAYDVAMTHAQKWWEDYGRDNLLLGKDQKFNAATYRSVMMHRFGYKEKSEKEITGNADKPVVFTTEIGGDGTIEQKKDMRDLLKVVS